MLKKNLQKWKSRSSAIWANENIEAKIEMFFWKQETLKRLIRKCVKIGMKCNIGAGYKSRNRRQRNCIVVVKLMKKLK